MKAVGATRALPASDPACLVDLELPVPVLGARDVLVDVRAVSVNPVDFKVRRSLPESGPPRVLGWDAAGVVVAIGSDVASFAVGDEVWFAGAIGRDGTNAQFCVVDERIVGTKPRRATFAEAAAMPLTALTAYEAFFDRMRIPRGDASRGRRVLVIGAAGGVGSIAVQLAKALTEATVVGTASRAESVAWVEELGADLVVDHRRDLREQLERAGIRAIDYVLCTADTDDYTRVAFDLVAPQGVVAFIVPPKRPMDLAPLHTKSAAIAWELMFTRSRFETPDMAEQGRILTELASLMDAGRIRTTLRESLGPICARTLREAHAKLESGTTIGKLVVEGW